MIRVIVADDEQKVCQLIHYIIDWESLDMEVVGIASNGIEALNMIRETNPDLVLTDIRMPGYDGLELLKRAREYNPDMEFIIISGYSHFEYAHTAIRYGVKDYILKPIKKEVLEETLREVRERYYKLHEQEKRSRILQEEQEQNKVRVRETMLRDLESGQARADREEVNEKYYFHFGEGLFQTFLVQADVRGNEDLGGPSADKVTELLYSKAVTNLKKQMAPICIELETFYRDGQIAGILNYESKEKREVRIALRNFINDFAVEVQMFAYLQFHLSTSVPVEDFAGLLECFQQAEDAMAQRLFAKNTFFLEKIPSKAEYNEDDFYKSFSFAVRKSLEIQDGGQLAQAVTKLKLDGISKGLNGYQILHLVQDAYHLFLLSTLFQQEYHFEDRKSMEDQFNKKSLLCNSAERLFRFLQETCQEDLERTRVKINREKAKPILKAKEFMQEHYAEPLTLEEVGNAVGFSSSYFSTVFRKETGTTFLEYLTNLRIEAAKQALRETSMTIELVCRSVGANDYKRFSKTFKKATGVTPKEYRKLYS